MEPHQYEAIYDEVPEFLNIVMDIILQITKREANKVLKGFRDQIVKSNQTTEYGEKIFYDWTNKEMPAYHRIRKLSLQTLEDQGEIIENLSLRAGHKDQKATREISKTGRQKITR